MNDLRSIATNVLKVAAWLNLAGGVILWFTFIMAEPSMPVASTDAYDPLATQEQRKAERLLTIYAWAGLFGGVFGWALCTVVAKVADESRETHHIIDRLTRGG